MANVDPTVVTRTAETLLAEIEAAARAAAGEPSRLRDLAEAFSLVAANVNSREGGKTPAKLL